MAISSADQHDPRGRQQIGTSPNQGGNNTPQETGSTQEIKKNKTVSEVLKFPLNRQDMYPAHIVFHPYKIDTGLIDASLGEVFNSPLVKNYKEKTNSKSVNDDVAATGYDEAAMGIDPATSQNDANVAVEESQEQGDRAAIRKEIADTQEVMGSKQTDLRAYRDTSAPAIQLFFPPSLQYNDAVNYNSANLGAGGATALAALNQGESIVGALGKGLGEGMESIFNLASGSLSAEAAKVAASRISSKLPAGYAAAGSSALQTGLNPGTRLLFDQPSMRSFAFSFKLIPTSPDEARIIRRIVKELRFQMYPREIDLSPGIPIGYQFPNIYRIEFGFDNGSLQIPKIQYCYLKDVQAAYNSTSGGVFFDDGHPTEIDLNLTFLEYRALSKRDIEAGF